MPRTFVAGEVLTATNMELLPKGRVGSASVTSNQASITTIVDLTSLTVTWTAISSHYYMIVGHALFQDTVTTDVVGLQISDASNNSVQQANGFPTVANQNFTLHAVALLTGLSGSVTYKLRGVRTGSGTVQMTASSTLPAIMFVVDLGA